ncbi:hypothetical protein B0T25DRAFT_536958 [Lasiosphaeria hispida]|uniref:Uncharacterized protein n=1 Tax=Lasiosphaeria hispida TaxID=260671 RepID=A0AAJ0HKH4_9PEZI|nr:hypothetical protein B0T25DRAFT_536958 [Lasiosphaeria hispida]
MYFLGVFAVLSVHLTTIFITLAQGTAAEGVWTTPHDSYSSSVGVLGCKINTDRVAYWPGAVDCDNFCVKLSYGDRSVHLLRIDQSGGAFDVSYDAWNYLQTGESAATAPITGGPVAMEYEEVEPEECADLIYTPGSKLPFSASNSMNFISSCLAQPKSYVAKNHVLYNICDSVCSLGFDEECSLDLSVSNQPSCAHTLGLTSKLTTAPVYNIQYQSGQTVVAGTGEIAASRAKVPASAKVRSSMSEKPTTFATLVAPTAAAFKEQTKTWSLASTTNIISPTEDQASSSLAASWATSGERATTTAPIPMSSESATSAAPAATISKKTIDGSSTQATAIPSVSQPGGGTSTTLATVVSSVTPNGVLSSTPSPQVVTVSSGHKHGAEASMMLIVCAILFLL